MKSHLSSIHIEIQVSQKEESIFTGMAHTYIHTMGTDIHKHYLLEGFFASVSVRAHIKPHCPCTELKCL